MNDLYAASGKAGDISYNPHKPHTRSREGPPVIRWLIWSCYVIAWTIALEVKIPPPPSGVGVAFLEPYRLLIAKSMHVAAYIGMTWLAAWIVLPARHRSLLMFFLMAHACATELLQDILEPYCHRRGSLMDVAFNHLGILIGMLLTWKRWTGGDDPT